ncbi:hypothetical protein [Streptomyces sp. B5E4]|uniref:hypothetical protein n=1 Tax=Streptomyces sp. B5E4 TaxID=3153568 RepID=UPI00325D04F9
MSQPSTPTPPRPPQTPRSDPFITQHTAIILVTAVVIGQAVGNLAYLSGTPAAGAALAGLLSAGSSVPVLRALIG